MDIGGNAPPPLGTKDSLVESDRHFIEEEFECTSNQMSRNGHHHYLSVFDPCQSK